MPRLGGGEEGRQGFVPAQVRVHLLVGRRVVLVVGRGAENRVQVDAR